MNQPSGSMPSRSPQKPNQPDKQPQRPRITGRTWLVLMGVMLLFDLLFYVPQFMSGGAHGPSVQVPYSTFLSQVNANNVKTTKISGTDVSGDFKTAYRVKTGSTTRSYPRYTTTVLPEVLNTTVDDLRAHKVQIELQSGSLPAWAGILTTLLQFLPLLLFFGLFYFGSRAARSQQQGIFGFGQSRAKLYTEERPSTTFGDVAGVDAAKSELQEIVQFLRDPSFYHRLGARIPKGVLLVGPPGTGKTLLARAVAGEARVPFFSISATEFVEMFVGVGASRVRDLFDRAKQAAPAIIFVDEIDAIGGARSNRGPMGGGANDEREQTLNQLLVSLDGFEPNEAVIVMAATNRADTLDPALLRPGRFDREVVVDLPDRNGREAILRIHSKGIPLAPDVDLAAIARMTPGMSGADLANLANEAALTAARRRATHVIQADFYHALDRIQLGAEGPALLNEEERRTVAYHEAGHALVAIMLPNVDPVQRITITPRGRSLGVTQFLPVDERRNYRRDYLLNRMAVGMGGRAAEEVAFSDITSGAQNDLQMVTSLARTMVTQLGMSPKLGPAYLGGAGDDALNGRAYNPWEPKAYSDETASEIDNEVARLVDEAHDRAVDVIRSNQEALRAVAEALVQDETLDRDQFAAIVNAHRPGQPPLPVPTGEPTPTGEQPLPAVPNLAGQG